MLASTGASVGLHMEAGGTELIARTIQSVTKHRALASRRGLLLREWRPSSDAHVLAVHFSPAIAPRWGGASPAIGKSTWHAPVHLFVFGVKLTEVVKWLTSAR